MGHRRHPRAKLTVEGRRLAVHRVVDLRWRPARVAEAQGCSVATVYKWVRRFREEGDAGLLDRCSRPQRSPSRLSAEREAAILAYRGEHRVGAHVIAAALGEAQSTVSAVLARRGVPLLRHLDLPTGKVIRYERDRAGELVHIDIKKQGRVPDGGGWRVHGRDTANGSRHKHGVGYDFVHVAVDDFSRVAYAEVLPDEQGATAAAFLTRATAWFAARGVTVERVLTDNGSCYRSRVFRQAADAAGVRLKKTRPYRPQTNGKVERFNLTLKREWAWQRPYADNAERSAALTPFLHHNHHHRPHRALQGRSPMTRINNLPGTYT